MLDQWEICKSSPVTFKEHIKLACVLIRRRKISVYRNKCFTQIIRRSKYSVKRTSYYKIKVDENQCLKKSTANFTIKMFGKV